MNYRVRRAGPAELGTLAALRAADARERAPEGAPPATAPGTADGDAEEGYRAQVAGWLSAESARRLFWVALSGGEAVGFVSLLVVERMPLPDRDAGRWGYLAHLFVLPEHRGRGAGRLLVDAVIEHARAGGLQRLVLNPSPRSVPLYRRAGFGPASRLLALDLRG